MTLPQLELYVVEYSSGVNMGQEFFIKSDNLEAKVRDLLPSQGGLGAGFDLSGSTQIVPIIDLTETAEGSVLRQDLQVAVDFGTTQTEVENSTNTVLINTPGFYRVDVQVVGQNNKAEINLFDGATSKIIRYYSFGTTFGNLTESFVVYLRAGDSLRSSSFASTVGISTVTRQIADVSGKLSNPLGFSV